MPSNHEHDSAFKALGALARGPLLPTAAKALATRALHRLDLPRPDVVRGSPTQWHGCPFMLPRLRAALWCMALPARQHVMLLVASHLLVFVVVLPQMLAVGLLSPSGCLALALLWNRVVEYYMRLHIMGRDNPETLASGLPSIGVLVALLLELRRPRPVDFSAHTPQSQLEATYRDTLADLRQCRADLVLPLVMKERGAAEAYCQLAAPIEYYETLCTACVFEREYDAKQKSWEYRQLRDAHRTLSDTQPADLSLHLAYAGAVLCTVYLLNAFLRADGVRYFYLWNLAVLLAMAPYELSSTYFYDTCLIKQPAVPAAFVVARAFPWVKRALVAYYVASVLGVAALFRFEPPVSAYPLEQELHFLGSLWWQSGLYFSGLYLQ